jgi:lipopolysaccharide export system permease protein
MNWLNTFKIRILDRYIIRKFLGTFFFALLMIIIITVVFDISEKIDDFIDKKAPLNAIVFDYYFNFVPYFVSLFSSLFIFISVIFFTSKMAAQTEIIAILSSGISFRRFLYPYFIGACILALFSFVINDMIMPSANKNRLDFEDKYLKNPVIYLERNVHKQVEPGLFVYLESFSNSSETAYRFSMERYKDDRMVLASKLISESAQWDKVNEKWTIRDYYIRDVDSLGFETLQSGASIDTTINLHPSEFKRRANFIETMSIIQLNEFIENLKMQGADNVNAFLIELHKRIAFPFSTFILTLIGVSLSTRKVRGGIGIHVAIGIAISFLYILFMQFSAEFATKGSLHPVVAAWVPNIIFGIVAVLLYRLAPK